MVDATVSVGSAGQRCARLHDDLTLVRETGQRALHEKHDVALVQAVVVVGDEGGLRILHRKGKHDTDAEPRNTEPEVRTRHTCTRSIIIEGSHTNKCTYP